MELLTLLDEAGKRQAEKLRQESAELENRPMIFCSLFIHKIGGIGTVAEGRLVSGKCTYREGIEVVGSDRCGNVGQFGNFSFSFSSSFFFSFLCRTETSYEGKDAVSESVWHGDPT
jgi:hypothetical protein